MIYASLQPYTLPLAPRVYVIAWERDIDDAAMAMLLHRITVVRARCEKANIDVQWRWLRWNESPSDRRVDDHMRHIGVHPHTCAIYSNVGTSRHYARVHMYTDRMVAEKEMIQDCTHWICGPGGVFIDRLRPNIGST